MATELPLFSLKKVPTVTLKLYYFKVGQIVLLHVVKMEFKK